MTVSETVQRTEVDRRRAVPVDALPERVKAAILAREEESERLIGWVQLLIVVTLGTLYILAPRPTDIPDGAVQPVPWVLGVYLVVAVIRLWLAYRRFAPSWFLAGTIVVDMSLLIGLIWSIHIQYQQPPSFYLKAPTLLYVFIFISLRALRFDYRFVLTAGVTAMLCWLALPSSALAQSFVLSYEEPAPEAAGAAELVIQSGVFDAVVEDLEALFALPHLEAAPDEVPWTGLGKTLPQLTH